MSERHSLDLAGPRLKITRAHYHLQTLDDGCQRFLKTDPYYLTAEEEAEAGSHLVSFNVREDVPAPLSVILGDLLHNLRSALEHATWLIALRTNKPEILWLRKNANNITFPITRDLTGWKEHRLLPYLANDPATKAVLKRLQAHERPDGPGPHLRRLDDLWNIDKHRVLHGGFVSLDLSNVSFVPQGVFMERYEGVDVEMLITEEDTVEHGTEVARVRFLGGPWEPGSTKVRVENQPTAKVLFGSGELAFTTPAIAALVGHTADALAEIEALPDLPPPHGLAPQSAE